MQTICIAEDSIVKRVSLAVLTAVALIAVAACQDATSPGNTNDLAIRSRLSSNPPPPPIDTGATGSFIPATTLRADPTPKFFGPQYSIFQSASPTQRTTISKAPSRRAFDFTQNSFFFTVPITYLFNPTSKSGYIHFTNDPDGVSSSSNGMIKNHNGVLSGKGTLEIQTEEGLLVINLASVQQPPSFQGCGAPETFDAPTQNAGGVCFTLYFTDATLDGVQGSVSMNPGCDPTDFSNDEEEACFTD
jgi:hypothetical protein